MKNLFTRSVFGTYTGETITAIFKSGQSASYTLETFGLLTTDPAVMEIYSNDTAEVYFSRDPYYLTIPDALR